MLGIHLSLHPLPFSSPPLFFSFPSIREELVMFSGVAEDWMKSIRTQHLLSSAWTLRQEGSDHPNVNHTLAKWAWVLFLWSICTILSVREPVLFYSSSPCYQKFIFQKEKPNQMYRALGVGYKNVFRHLKKKINVFIWLHSVYQKHILIF